MQSITKRVVSDTYGDKYRNENLTLLLCLYNNDSMCKELLHNWFVKIFNSYDPFDDNKDMIPSMQSVCKDALEATQRVSTTVPFSYIKLHSTYSRTF